MELHLQKVQIIVVYGELNSNTGVQIIKKKFISSKAKGQKSISSPTSSKAINQKFTSQFATHNYLFTYKKLKTTPSGPK